MASESPPRESPVLLHDNNRSSFKIEAKLYALSFGTAITDRSFDCTSAYVDVADSGTGVDISIEIRDVERRRSFACTTVVHLSKPVWCTALSELDIVHVFKDEPSAVNMKQIQALLNESPTVCDRVTGAFRTAYIAELEHFLDNTDSISPTTSGDIECEESKMPDDCHDPRVSSDYDPKTVKEEALEAEQDGRDWQALVDSAVGDSPSHSIVAPTNADQSYDDYMSTCMLTRLSPPHDAGPIDFVPPEHRPPPGVELAYYQLANPSKEDLAKIRSSSYESSTMVAVATVESPPEPEPVAGTSANAPSPPHNDHNHFDRAPTIEHPSGVGEPCTPKNNRNPFAISSEFETEMRMYDKHFPVEPPQVPRKGITYPYKKRKKEKKERRRREREEKEAEEKEERRRAASPAPAPAEFPSPVAHSSPLAIKLVLSHGHYSVSPSKSASSHSTYKTASPGYSRVLKRPRSPSVSSTPRKYPLRARNGESKERDGNGDNDEMELGAEASTSPPMLEHVNQDGASLTRCRRGGRRRRAAGSAGGMEEEAPPVLLDESFGGVSSLGSPEKSLARTIDSNLEEDEMDEPPEEKPRQAAAKSKSKTPVKTAAKTVVVVVKQEEEEDGDYDDVDEDELAECDVAAIARLETELYSDVCEMRQPTITGVLIKRIYHVFAENERVSTFVAMHRLPSTWHDMVFHERVCSLRPPAGEKIAIIYPTAMETVNALMAAAHINNIPEVPRKERLSIGVFDSRTFEHGLSLFYAERIMQYAEKKAFYQGMFDWQLEVAKELKLVDKKNSSNVPIIGRCPLQYPRETPRHIFSYNKYAYSTLDYISIAKVDHIEDRGEPLDLLLNYKCLQIDDPVWQRFQNIYWPSRVRSMSLVVGADGMPTDKVQVNTFFMADTQCDEKLSYASVEHFALGFRYYYDSRNEQAQYCRAVAEAISHCGEFGYYEELINWRVFHYLLKIRNAMCCTIPTDRSNELLKLSHQRIKLKVASEKRVKVKKYDKSTDIVITDKWSERCRHQKYMSDGLMHIHLDHLETAWGVAVPRDFKRPGLKRICTEEPSRSQSSSQSTKSQSQNCSAAPSPFTSPVRSVRHSSRAREEKSQEKKEPEQPVVVKTPEEEQPTAPLFFNTDSAMTEQEQVEKYAKEQEEQAVVKKETEQEDEVDSEQDEVDETNLAILFSPKKPLPRPIVVKKEEEEEEPERTVSARDAMEELVIVKSEFDKEEEKEEEEEEVRESIPSSVLPARERISSRSPVKTPSRSRSSSGVNTR